MKAHMLPFAFSKNEIATVRAISNQEGASIRELSAIVGKTESSISKDVKTLESKGIVKTKKQGLKKTVEISDRNYALSLSDMFKAEPFVPWEKLISNSNIAVLFKSATGEESFEYELSSVSSWRARQNLSLHGLFASESEGPYVGDVRLSQFIDEYSDHISRKYLKENLPTDAVILWRSGYRCLYKIREISNNEKENLLNGTFPTALSVSPDYGMQFLTSDSYFYYEPKLNGLAIEDVVLHTLLIDIRRQAYHTYALLIALKAEDEIDMRLLLAKSRNYKIEEEVKNLINYIKSHGKKRKWPLPKLDEFRQQADLYGIVIK